MSRRTLLGVLGSLVLGACSSGEEPADTPRPVQLTQVQMGSLLSSSVFAGEVRPRYEMDLAFRIGGKITQRNVDVGAVVRRGDELARLDSADVDLQSDAAQADVDAASANFAFASAEYDRYQELFRQKMIGASTLDIKRTDRDIAKLRAEQAQAVLAVKQNQAEYATLPAPEDGVITGLFAEAGQVVNPGQAVMRLARQTEPEIAITVPESRLDEFRSATTLVVELLTNHEKHYAARVREIAPAADPMTRTFAVRVSILEPDAAVQWGMTANVAVRGDESRAAALLPLSSIYHANDGAPAVWIYDPVSHAVSLRPVSIESYREDGVLIAAGLRQDEWVVSAGVHKLQPGQIVRPYESKATAAATE